MQHSSRSDSDQLDCFELHQKCNQLLILGPEQKASPALAGCCSSLPVATSWCPWEVPTCHTIQACACEEKLCAEPVLWSRPEAASETQKWYASNPLCNSLVFMMPGPGEDSDAVCRQMATADSTWCQGPVTNKAHILPVAM